MVLVAGGCSSSGTGGTASSASSAAPGSTTSTGSTSGSSTGSTPASTATGGTSDQVLRILVSNDDGIEGEGLDVLVEALRTLPDVEIEVSVPSQDRSGTGSTRADPPPEGRPATTRSGFAATAVDGYPADAMEWGLTHAKSRFHVAISGINFGPNLGPVIDISGTVGSARLAARSGIPALAVSAGLGEEVDFASAAELSLDWVREHRAELLAAPAGATITTIDNLNVPSCASGAPRGLKEVPAAKDLTSGNPLAVADCGTDVTDPVDDIEAVLNGWAAISVVSSAVPAPA